MKKTLLLTVMIFFGLVVIQAQNIWLNEFHYDNVGTDAGEFIEVVIENAGNYTLADFAVTLYNGNNGQMYDSKSLSQFTASVTSGNFSFFYYVYPENGIQNGESDGIAISYQGVLIPGQFLSYEGTLTAVDGPAAGVTSDDIGVTEIATDPGKSLQLAGTGSQFDEFTWQMPAAETMGDVNTNQFFGGFTPDPEPSNYPADFIATVDGLSITLTWTDSDGENLPSGYLILGEQMITSSINFTTPTDGVPVADDMDWTLDNAIAVNVSIGQQTITINNVQSGTGYNFVIFPYSNSGEYIDYKTDGTPPYAEAFISSLIIINQEDFEGGDLGTWIPYNIIGEQVWTWAEFNGDGYAKMNGYSGQSFENEDWLVSPNLFLDDVNSISFTFLSAMNFAGPALQLFVSLDYTDGGSPVDYSWTEITDQADWSTGTYTWTSSGIVDLSDYASDDFHLAFRYTSTTSLSSIWELDNLFVYSDTGVGISNPKSETLITYPNPATGNFNILSQESGMLLMTNLTGQTVLQKQLEAGHHQLNIEGLPQGIYVIRFSEKSGRVLISKLIIK